MSTPARLVVLPLILPLLASAALAQESLVDFSTAPVGQSPPGFTLRGTNGYASRLAVQEVPHTQPPVRYARVEYNFEADAHAAGWIAGQGRKTCILGCWIRIPDDHWVLELDLEGDGSGHGLVLSVGEPNAEWFNYDLGRLDFTGRKTVRVDLRTDWRDSAGPAANKRLDPPLWLASVNLEQRPDGPARGTLGVYAIRALKEEAKGLSAISATWAVPFAGAFTTEDVPAFYVKLKNLSAEAISGKTHWTVRSGAEPTKSADDTFALPASGEQLLKLGLGGLPVGYYEADLTLDAGGETRTYRNSLAIIPPARPDPKRRFGAGEAYPGHAGSESLAEWVQAIALLGGSWTLVHLPFATYDGVTTAPAEDAQRAIIEAASEHGVAIVAGLGDLPKDLVVEDTSQAVYRPAVSLPQFADRYAAAASAAATSLRGLIYRWLILHLDPIFLPRPAVPDQAPPSYPEFLQTVRDRVLAADPQSGLVAGLFTRRLDEWTRRGNLKWPEGVGFYTEALHDAMEDFGGARSVLGEMSQWKKAQQIGGEYWITVYPERLGAPGREPGPAFAEGLALQLVEAAYAAPDAHLLYLMHRDHPEEGGLTDHQGQITAAGVAFAICTAQLRDAEPVSVVEMPSYRGYRFRCPSGDLAAIWPTSRGATLRLAATKAAVEHYGAVQRYPDVPAGATEIKLTEGVNFLRGPLGLPAGM